MTPKKKPEISRYVRPWPQILLGACLGVPLGLAALAVVFFITVAKPLPPNESAAVEAAH